MSDVIQAGKVVSLAYTLRDEDGEVLDSSADDGPLHYLHGAENIVPGLEKALEGRAVGDELRVVVQPEEAYGDFEEEGVQTVERSMFPDDVELEVGLQFVTEDEDGDPMPFWVADVDGEQITVDFNHPLAGQVLDFEVQVVAIRDASAEEQAHGHPHEGDDAH